MQVDDIIHLGILFSFVRFWREMVSESAPPPRRPTFELPLPPDVIAAHAAATAGVSPAGKGGKDPGRKKKKKKGKGRGKGESPQGPSFDDMEEGRAGVVTPPVGGSGAAYSIRGPGDARGFTPGGVPVWALASLSLTSPVLGLLFRCVWCATLSLLCVVRLPPPLSCTSV